MAFNDFETMLYCMAFSQIKGFTLTTASQILERVGSERAFFQATERELNALMGFSNRVFSSDFRNAVLEKMKREAEYVDAHQIVPLYFRNDDYPAHLLDCGDAPLMIYTLGHTDFNAMHLLSIVGTRHATSYGVDFVEKFVADIARESAMPVAIVSGLAFGIDVAAHKAAIDNNLPTIAVLGHGLNTIYPVQHRGVAVNIINKGGMLATEYTSVDATHPGNFLARNRIVAGMSEALVVAESGEKGGSLVTARIASAYSRDVFALPGRVSDKWSVGCNRLIATNSASLVENASDFMNAMGWERRQMVDSTQSLFDELTEAERRICDYLVDNPDTPIARLSVELNLRHGPLNATLLDLEFKELVVRKPGGVYAVSSRYS